MLASQVTSSFFHHFSAAETGAFYRCAATHVMVEFVWLADDYHKDAKEEDRCTCKYWEEATSGTKPSFVIFDHSS